MEAVFCSAEERVLEGLSAPQREAVLHGEGPLLIIAGAGTGKTTVLTRRTRHLLALLSFVSRAKDEDVGPGEYRAWAEMRAAEADAGDAAEKDEIERHLELASFYEAHERLLREGGAADFGDQIVLALRMLR